MKSDFSVAVHALVYLSVKGCTLSSDALADNICTNAARVRKVMARLKKAGLVGAREGSEGGFCPQVPPAELTLDDFELLHGLYETRSPKEVFGYDRL